MQFAMQVVLFATAENSLWNGGNALGNRGKGGSRVCFPRTSGSDSQYDGGTVTLFAIRKIGTLGFGIEFEIECHHERLVSAERRGSLGAGIAPDRKRHQGELLGRKKIRLENFESGNGCRSVFAESGNAGPRSERAFTECGASARFDYVADGRVENESAGGGGCLGLGAFAWPRPRQIQQGRILVRLPPVRGRTSARRFSGHLSVSRFAYPNGGNVFAQTRGKRRIGEVSFSRQGTLGSAGWFDGTLSGSGSPLWIPKRRKSLRKMPVVPPSGFFGTVKLFYYLVRLI